ncbi:MAG: hypothetical protein ACYDDC_04050, partial [Thermoplasmataceae archaeon]
MNVIFILILIGFTTIISIYSKRIEKIFTIGTSIFLIVLSIIYLMGYLNIQQFSIDHFKLSFNYLTASFLLILSMVWMISGFNTVIANWTRTRSFFGSLLFFGIMGTLFSGNSITILIFWETFTISATFILGLYNRRELMASFVFLGLGEISLLLLIAGAAISYSINGSFSIVALLNNPISLSFWVSGFIIKAGIIPFQISEWYSLGMSGIDSSRAILIGVMIPTISIYGIDSSVLNSVDFQGLSIAMIIIGSLSIFVGAVYASSSENPRILAAYSTVENVGAMIILTGVVSLSIVTGNMQLAQFASIGVLIFALMHGIGKSIILGSTPFNTDSFNNQEWRSISKKGLMIASISMMGLIPFGGGIGEWMLLESLFITSLSGVQYYAIVAVIAGSLAALGAGISVVVFTKFVSFIGTSEYQNRPTAESRKKYTGGYLLLILPLISPLLFYLFRWHSNLIKTPLDFLSGGEIVPNGYMLFSPYNKGVFGVLSPTFIILAMLVILSFVYILKPKNYREVEPWSGGVYRKKTYNSFNYSNPTRLTFYRLFPKIEEIID